MESRGEGHHLLKLTKYTLEFRSLDGTQNNLTQPDLNSAVLSLRGSVRPISLMSFYPRGLTAPFAH